jgi:hypothetical protein
MGRQHMSFGESASWLHPSVFTDTQRVDLFNDPKWETAPPPAVIGAQDGRDGASRWVLMKAMALRLVPMKRGQHSHRAA